MTLRTGEDILICRRKFDIALCGGIILEEALDLSTDRILNDVYDVFYSPNSHQYVQGDTSIITRLQTVQMLCCVTDPAT